MVARLRTQGSKVVAIAGIVITLATLILPVVRTPQTVALEGPTAPYGASSTTLSGYYIPPVDQGTRVTIVITGYSPSSLYLSVFSTAEGGLATIGTPILIIHNFSSPLVRVSFVSPSTQPYGIYVFSGNRTHFVIAVDGNWSGYYFLRGYTSEGLFVALVGLLGYSYFRTWEKRAALEEVARKEASSGGAKPLSALTLSLA